MKKIIAFLILFSGFYLTVNAQGTLEFNQVKLVGSVETIPTGKVWKLCGILPSTRLTTVAEGFSGSSATAATNHIITVNGTNTYYATSDAIGATYGNASMAGYAAVASNISASDIWLPQGTTLAAGTGVFRISVIEFNVAQ